MSEKHPAIAGLSVGLKTLQEAARAPQVALLALRPTGLVLITQYGIDQVGIDLAQMLWARRRAELERGEIARRGAAMLWPLFDGPELVGAIFFDHAPSAFPDEASRADAASMATRLHRVYMPYAETSYLEARPTQAKALDDFLETQLIMALIRWAGNVAAVSRSLGISRETVYTRAARYDIDITEFRRKK